MPVARSTQNRPIWSARRINIPLQACAETPVDQDALRHAFSFAPRLRAPRSIQPDLSSRWAVITSRVSAGMLDDQNVLQ
ncbi:hypothetical protein PENSTE_c038G01048 [Penicillium steckii]|uniref:Uncharacterized protein n=1 Tax=Penicillium steckii TaxID=303698 RepID=A0A1V6SJA1_9EURO|nr:hypothetical protein PENSTE_c038G01048 [Penicillium steckii]